MAQPTNQDLLDALNEIKSKLDSLAVKPVGAAPATSASDAAWDSLHAFKNFDGSPLLSDPGTRAKVVAYVSEQRTWPEIGSPLGPDVSGWADPKTFAASFIMRLRYLPGELTGFDAVYATQVDLDYLRSLSFAAFCETFWRSWGGGPGGDSGA